MKVIFNLTERQVQKALILSGLNDADMDKINKVLPEYPEIDITDFVNQNDTEGSAFCSLQLLRLPPLVKWKLNKDQLNAV